MSMRSVVAAVLAVVYVAEAQEWSQDAATGCFYKHVAEPQTWFAAIRHCHVSEQASELVALGSESEAQFVASLSPTTTWVAGSFDEGSWNVGASLWQPSQPGNFREAVHLCAKQPAAGHKLATEACSARFAFVCRMCGSNPTVAPAATEKPQPVPQQRGRAEVVEAVEAVKSRGRRDETTTSTTTGAAGVSSTTSTTTGAAGVSSTTTTTTGAAGSTTTTTTTAAAGVSSTTSTTTTGAPGSSTTTTSTAAPEHPAEGDAIPAPAGPAGPGSPGMGPGDVPVAFPPRQGVLVDGTDNTPVDEAGVATAAPLSAGIIALIISAVMATLVAVAVVARHATKADEDETTTEAGVAQAPQAPAMTAFEDAVIELQWDDSL